MLSKNIVYSKTFWFNAISLVVAVATALLDDDFIKQNPGIVQLFGLVVTVGNVIIRFWTTQSVHIMPLAKEEGDDGYGNESGFRLILLPLLGLLALSGSAYAADDPIVAVDVTGLQGTYLLTVEGGQATVTPIRLLRPGTPPPVNPIPPDDPPVGQLTPFEKAIQKLTADTLSAGGSKTTGAAISSAYSLIGDSVGSGEIPTTKALEAVKSATNLILTNQPDRDKWSNWRTSVGDALTQLQQEGALGTKEQYASTLRSIARGMNAATGFNGSVDNPNALFGGIDITKLMDLIRLVMELIKLFSGLG